MACSLGSNNPTPNLNLNNNKTKRNAALLCFALLCLAIIGTTTILIVILVTGTRRRSHGWKATSETLWWSMKIGQFVISFIHSKSSCCLNDMKDNV